MQTGKKTVILRRAAGWSQARLARAAKISRSTLEDLEKDKRRTHPISLEGIARAIGCSAAWLGNKRLGLADLSAADLRRLGERHGSDFLRTLAETMESAGTPLRHVGAVQNRPARDREVINEAAEILLDLTRHVSAEAQRRAGLIEEAVQAILDVLNDTLTPSERRKRLETIRLRFGGQEPPADRQGKVG